MGKCKSRFRLQYKHLVISFEIVFKNMTRFVILFNKFAILFKFRIHIANHRKSLTSIIVKTDAIRAVSISVKQK